MQKYIRIYEMYFKRYRVKMRGDLSPKTIQNRVRKVLDKLSERDRHLLIMAATYSSTRNIAKLEDTNLKRLDRRIAVAVNHLITPENVEYVTGKKLFKHKGALLYTLDFDTRTINALKKKSNITTDEDLKAWLRYNDYQLFRLPGCGKVAIVQIVNRLYKLN